MNDPYDGYEWMTRPCLGCGEPISQQWDYAYCGACQDTKTCPHGVLLKDPCGRCDSDSDFAYDAARERR